MKKTILLSIAILILITACSFKSSPKNGKEIEITNGQKIYSQSGSISGTAENSFNVPFEGYTRFDYDLINFRRHLPDMMSEDLRITVSIIPQDKIPNDYLLYKNQGTQMDERYKNFKMSKWEKDNNKERGVKYRKGYVDYIASLKCGTRVESSSIALGIGSKTYQTNCTYFDKNNGAKNIHLMYSYTYASKGSKFSSDETSTNLTPEKMQKQFKQDIKSIFDSLVIHDMDIDKMNKHNLIHNKKYDINTENITKNYYD